MSLTHEEQRRQIRALRGGGGLLGELTAKQTEAKRRNSEYVGVGDIFKRKMQEEWQRMRLPGAYPTCGRCEELRKEMNLLGLECRDPHNLELLSQKMKGNIAAWKRSSGEGNSRLTTLSMAAVKLAAEFKDFSPMILKACEEHERRFNEDGSNKA